MLAIISLLTVCGAIQGFAGQPEAQKTLVKYRAEWLQPIDIQLPGPPVNAVLLFGVDETPDPKWIVRFAEFGSNDRVQVVAICQAPADSVKTVTAGWPSGLPIGAEAKIKGVAAPDRLPRLLIIGDSLSEGLLSLPADDVALHKLSGVLASSVNDVRSGDGTSSPPDDRFADSASDFETQELVLAARGEPASVDMRSRVKALRGLRGRLPSDQMLELCDAMLHNPPKEIEDDFFERAWWRGEVSYERHLADPDVNDKQSPLSGWQQAFNAYSRAGRDNGAWWSLAAYESVVAAKSFFMLERDYQEHLGDEPEEILIRDAIIQQVGKRASRSQLRQVLRDWLPREADRTLAGSIASLALEPQLRGDAEALSAVQARLKGESDIRLKAFLEELVAELQVRAANHPVASGS